MTAFDAAAIRMLVTDYGLPVAVATATHPERGPITWESGTFTDRDGQIIDSDEGYRLFKEALGIKGDLTL